MLLTVQGISFSKHMELKLTPYFYPGRRESFPKPTGIRAAAQCVLGKAGHCLHQARCPEPTHSNFPSPKGSLAPAAPCSRQTLSRKEQTKGSHKSLQPISPKFSGGMGFKHPFTAQGACAPGACEKTAGGSQEPPLGSKCSRLFWALLMCTAAASPGPGDDFVLPSSGWSLTETWGGEENLREWGRQETSQHALFHPEHSDFASNTVQWVPGSSCPEWSECWQGAEWQPWYHGKRDSLFLGKEEGISLEFEHREVFTAY